MSYKVKTIQSQYPLLFCLLKGRDFKVETALDGTTVQKMLIKKELSFVVCQKDKTFIGIQVKGLESFHAFLEFCNIGIQDSNIRKCSKYLRRAFSMNQGGAAATGHFNGRYINEQALAVNYKGAAGDLKACVDGAMFASPEFLSKIWGTTVKTGDSFLGTVIINGAFSKGKITAKELTPGLDLVTYDIKKSISFAKDLNYIHLMVKLPDAPVDWNGQAVLFRNPNGSRREFVSLQITSENKLDENHLYLSNLDLQSIINFELFAFMPSLVEEYLKRILHKLHSNGIRELLGGYQPEEIDDRWFLQKVLQDTTIEIKNYPGFLRKCRVFFASALEKLNIFQLKEGQKFQIPNHHFVRAYLTPDPSAFDSEGIYQGQGDIPIGAGHLKGANLYLGLGDPKICAEYLKTMGGADLDGDSVLLSCNPAICKHITELPPIPADKVVENKQGIKDLFTNPFESFVPVIKDKYNELSILKIINQKEKLFLGHIINQLMVLTQVAKDKADVNFAQKLWPILNRACLRF